MAEDFLPGQGPNLGEAVLGVVRIHGEDLLALGRAQNFDYFDELVDARLARKDGLAKHQLRNHAAH